MHGRCLIPLMKWDRRRSGSAAALMSGRCLNSSLYITVMWKELFKHLPDIRATEEPDRLLSSFINGIKHLPCSFSPGVR